MTKHIIPIEIHVSQLPLSCPLPEQTVWNKHPKVYLPIEENKHVMCPYCGARYVLREE